MKNIISAIAMIGNGSKIIGYRLAEVTDGCKFQINELSTEALTSGLKKHIFEIDNLGFYDNHIIGTQGDYDRIPIINTNGRFITHDNVTIIYKVRGCGFVLMDYNGNELVYCTPNDISYLLSTHQIGGLANGKIVYRNGFEYISAIKGNFIEVTPREIEYGSGLGIKLF
jgi:hypothetical protein